jgi:hypothetical protein
MFTGLRFGGTVEMSCPSIRMRPSVGVSKPASMRSRVVLPQPDGPSRQKNSPSSMVRETLSTATMRPNRLVTFSKVMMGLLMAPQGRSLGRSRAACPPAVEAGSPWTFRAMAVRTTVRTMRIVEAALTSGVTENRTME